MLLSNWEIEHGYINFMKVKSHYIFLFQTLRFSYNPRSLRSSHWKCSVQKDVRKSFAELAENTCVGVSFNEKETQPCNFIKRDFDTGIFLWTPFSQSSSGWLPLQLFNEIIIILIKFALIPICYSKTRQIVPHSMIYEEFTIYRE